MSASPSPAADERRHLAVRAALQTDVGVVREHNEDSAYADPDGRFFVVADGMGGHGGGDIASAMAVDLVRQSLDAARTELARVAAQPSTSGRRAIAALLDRTARRANDAVVARGVREPALHRMGSTLEIAVIAGGDAYLAHVGDSRTYLVRAGRAKQVTTDHTIAESMRRAGGLTDEEARVSPMRSVLSNAIGVTPELEVDLVHLALEPGDRLLLCSDGLYDYFERDELASRLAHGTVDRALAEMIASARDRGGHDNLTGIAIEVTAAPAPHQERWNEPTRPRFAMDPRLQVGPSHPFDGVGDEAICRFVEQTIREASRPHVVAPLVPAGARR